MSRASHAMALDRPPPFRHNGVNNFDPPKSPAAIVARGSVFLRQRTVCRRPANVQNRVTPQAPRPPVHEHIRETSPLGVIATPAKMSRESKRYGESQGDFDFLGAFFTGCA